MHNMYEELGERFEENLLKVASKFAESEHSGEISTATHIPKVLELDSGKENHSCNNYCTLSSFSILVGIEEEELERWKEDYKEDLTFSLVLSLDEIERSKQFLQYLVKDDELLYFIDWNRNL